MPDQSSAASEHAIIQQVTAPLATFSDTEAQHPAAVEFPVVLRGYDRLAVDAYVKKTNQLVTELQATRSPEGAVRRALERVGEQISGILQRAHDTAEQITAQSRREAEERLERARQEAAELTVAARTRVKDLDADADRIWGERQRIVDDARDLARQLVDLADAAAERFPPADDGESTQEALAGGAAVGQWRRGREAQPAGDELDADEGDDADEDDQTDEYDDADEPDLKPSEGDEGDDTMILPSRRRPDGSRHRPDVSAQRPDVSAQRPDTSSRRSEPRQAPRPGRSDGEP